MTARPIKAFAGAGALAILLAAAGSPGSARAAEVRLLSAAAMQSVFKNLAGEFERTEGHKLIISYGTIVHRVSQKPDQHRGHHRERNAGRINQA
jgi:ABC-type molybdate transport system substrate-binding protein